MKNIIVSLLAVPLFFGGMVSKGQSNQSPPNQPFTVIAEVKVKPGNERAFKEAAARVLLPTRSEPGNISYDFHQSTEDSTEFATVEKWRSQEDISQHMNTPHMQTFFKAVGAMFESGYPQIKTYVKFEN